MRRRRKMRSGYWRRRNKLRRRFEAFLDKGERDLSGETEWAIRVQRDIQDLRELINWKQVLANNLVDS
jgi:hypothetical protein